VNSREENARRWESSWAAGTLSCIAAVCLILSPFVFHFTAIQTALWNALAVGAVAFVLVLIGLGNIGRYIWPSFLNLALAAWLICAPYVLGYADRDAPYWVNVVLGGFIALLAIWRIRDRPGRSGQGS
jgi:hypothetical protein